MSKRLHIFDLSFFEGENDFVNGVDYYHSLKGNDLKIALSRKWSLIKGKDTLFNLKHDIEGINEVVSHDFDRADKIFIYYGKKRYTVMLIDYDDGFIFMINEFDTFVDLMDDFKKLGNEKSYKKYKEMFNNYFENNFEWFEDDDDEDDDLEFPYENCIIDN